MSRTKNGFAFAIITLLITAINLPACKKDNNAANASNKVRTLFDVGDSIMFTFTYDAQGRLTLLQWSGYEIGKSVYAYSGNTVTEYDYDGTPPYNPSTNDTTIYTLNSQDLATNSVENNGGFSSTYSYDANGDVTYNGYLQYNGFPSATFTWLSENLIKEDDGMGQTIIYTYYPNKTDNRNDGLSFQADIISLIGNSFTDNIGNKSKNLINTVSIFNNGTLSAIDTITYEFDTYGRITKQVNTDGDSYTFSY